MPSVVMIIMEPERSTPAKVPVTGASPIPGRNVTGFPAQTSIEVYAFSHWAAAPRSANKEASSGASSAEGSGAIPVCSLIDVGSVL